VDLRNLLNALVCGNNPVVTAPHRVPGLQDAAASKLLIDPVWHKSARFCDGFIQPRPGGDFSLAMAVARLLFERGWTEAGFEKYCDNVPEFRALAFTHSVASWCEDADVSPAAAEDIARRLHDGPTAILIGWGMGRRVNGGSIVRALDALSAISGNLGVPGGGASFYFKRRKTFDHSFIQGIDGAPRSILEPLFGPEVLALQDPPIQAVWITAGNPVAMLPESATVDRALRSREFVCVVDSWPNDTTRAATLVLPTTTLLESDDLLGGYGHHWVGVSRPVVPPPSGVKSDLEILQELSRRTGMDGVLDGSARDWKERILRKDAGFTVGQLESDGPRRSALSPKVLFADRKFATRTGRVNLITEGPARTQVSPEYPLYLMALSTEKAQSSQWSKGQPPGPAVVTVHPDAAHGIPDGSIARLESAIGSLPIQVRHDSRQRRDVALLSKGGHLRENRNANLLSRARATDLGGGGALYDEPVRLVR